MKFSQMNDTCSKQTVYQFQQRILKNHKENLHHRKRLRQNHMQNHHHFRENYKENDHQREIHQETHHQRKTRISSRQNIVNLVTCGVEILHSGRTIR